jgi:phosphoglycerate dehydrogenase-like enzyme
MGGGDKKQHLLCALPFPENKTILDRIRKNHPNLKVTYHQTTAAAFAKDQGISDGASSAPDSTASISPALFPGSQLPTDIWADVTIVGTLMALPPKPELAPGLELVHCFSAGTNHLQGHPIYKDTDVPITTSSGVHGPAIAEWVILTALVNSRYWDMMHSWQVSKKWGPGHSMDSPLHTVRDKVGQRMGVLGYGSIGRQVAKVWKAMGGTVYAFTASPRTTPESKKDIGFIVPGTGDPEGEIPEKWFSGMDKKSMHDFLGQDLDHILISVPLTEQTRGMFGKEEFEILSKKNAFVTNISRGQILQQDELVAALEAFENDKTGTFAAGRKGLRGAALDVTDPEPLPEGHPLWSAPNCIVTPHVSGLGVAYAERCFNILEVNLDRRERGEKLINVVDRKKGY